MLKLSNRTVDVSYRLEGPSGTANDFEIPYANPEPWNSVRLDSATLAKVGAPSLSPSVDWAVNLDLGYLTESGVEGYFDISGADLKLNFYDNRTGNMVHQRSSSLTCTTSGEAQLEVDSVEDGRVIARWKHNDNTPAPIGNYKFTLFVERDEGTEVGAAGFITVVI